MVVDPERLTQSVHRSQSKLNGCIRSLLTELLGSERQRTWRRGLANKEPANRFKAW